MIGKGGERIDVDGLKFIGCTGTEDNLEQCSPAVLDMHCASDYAAGVVCNNTELSFGWQMSKSNY